MLIWDKRAPAHLLMGTNKEVCQLFLCSWLQHELNSCNSISFQFRFREVYLILTTVSVFIFFFFTLWLYFPFNCNIYNKSDTRCDELIASSQQALLWGIYMLTSGCFHYSQTLISTLIITHILLKPKLRQKVQN